jgi:hypothetical protein
MGSAEIKLEDLSPGQLAQSANEFCGSCRDLRKFATEVIDTLPAREDIDPSIIVGRFAAFASLCSRETPIPDPNTDCCSVINPERKCRLTELLDMSPQERTAKVQELSAVDIL